MNSDMMVALGSASVRGETIVGLNHHPAGAAVYLRRSAASSHAGDEVVRCRNVVVPQARQTCAVVGAAAAGSWGLSHGLNEHQVVIGVTGWRSKLPREAAGLTGGELVRLALERSHSSLHALDVLTDLIARHGQCGEHPQGADDHVFLIADPGEAFVVEAAGRYWALQECGQTRAVTGVALTRQDWRRLKPGLASLAIERGWWQDDGSKLDFAGCLDSKAASHGPARRRWGRASVALAQQAGAIDQHYFRRLLDEQHENNRPLRHENEAERSSSFVAALGRPRTLPLAWFAFGPPQSALYFPISPLVDLPAALGPSSHPETPAIPECLRQLAAAVAAGQLDAALVDEVLDRLQIGFDADAEEWLQREEVSTTGAQAMQQRHVEQFEKEWRRLHNIPEASELAAWAREEAVESPF